jgi:hypothetical protein
MLADHRPASWIAAVVPPPFVWLIAAIEAPYRHYSD